MKWIIALCLTAALTTSAFAHPGRTDRNGGHHDRKNGGYHYHGGGGGFSAPSVPVSPSPNIVAPRTKVRTKARTTARTVARHETRDETSPEPLKALRAPQYLLYLKRSIEPRPIVTYEERDDKYHVEYSSGGSMNLPESSVDRIEPIGVEPPEGVPTEGIVERVIDGDTVQLEGGEKVRLIGVDTPETVQPSKPVEAFGKEASEFTTKALEGQRVRLTYDQANTGTQQRDRYGRLLAYVARERDDYDINAELVRNGYAHAYTQYPLVRLDEFRQYEREARHDKRGLWGEGTSQPARAPPPAKSAEPVSTAQAEPSGGSDETVYVTRTGAKYHRGGCRYLSKSKIPMRLSEAVRGV